MERLNANFVIFGNGTGWFNALFEDIDDYSNFVIGTTAYSPFGESRIMYMLCRLAWGPRFGKYKNQNLLSRILISQICRKIKKKCKSNAICIFHRSNAFSHNEFFLNKLKKNMPGLHFVYWFTDIVSSVKLSEPNILDFVDSHFDLTITFEKYDAENYGFIYLETPYSYKSHYEEGTDKTIDLLYIGKAKLDVDPERYDKIITAYEKAEECGLSTKFYIFGVPEKLQKHKDRIIYNKFLPYSEVIKYVKKSKCILEVSQKGERGTTLRLFEAIAYKTNLLYTNNNLKNHKYFVPDNMKYIELNSNFEFDKKFVRKNAFYSIELCKYLSPSWFLNEVADYLM